MKPGNLGAVSYSGANTSSLSRLDDERESLGFCGALFLWGAPLFLFNFRR